MAQTFSHQQTVCQRVLTRDDRSIRSEVIIRLLEPEFAPQDFRGEYRCAFEIDGLDRPVREYGYGIDSLEALICANTRATYALWPFRDQLRWLDGSYNRSIADCVQIGDGGRRRLLREVLDEEDEANARMVHDMELIRRASAARPPQQRKFGTEHDAGIAATPENAANCGQAERDAVAEAARRKPVCTRRLTRGFTTDVCISIWRPTPVAARADDHLCVFEVLGLGEDSPRTALGSDAMQAIFIAMRGVDSRLSPWRDALRWFDLAYEDPALFANVLDAGRQRRLHAIIDEEIYAIDERRRLREEFHEQRKAYRADGKS